jgi:hypothetical protein
MSHQRSREAQRRTARPSFLENLYLTVVLRFTASDFVIRHRPGARALLIGRIPASKSGAIQSFFTHDLEPNVPAVTVCGGWQSRNRKAARVLRVHFLGRVDARLQQRIRNFLMEVLR